MNQEVLSICIPTYNRHPYLKRLLDALLPEVKALNGAVGVYITDNASTDETQILCQAYIESGLPLNYERNPENKGPDFNIAKAFNMGQGDFVWVLGDDEIVFKGALALLLELLSQKTDAMMCYLNPVSIKSEDDLRRSVSQIDAKEILRPEKMAGVMGVFVTFISAVIVNRKQLLARCGDIDSPRFEGTNLIQLSWVLNALARGTKFIFVRNHVFAGEANNSGGYKVFTVFGANLIDISRLLLGSCPSAFNKISDSALFFLVDRKFRPFSGEGFVQENIEAAFELAFGDRLNYRMLVKPFLMGESLCSKFFYFCFSVIRYIKRRFFF